MKLQKAKPLASFICSFGNGLFLRDGRHLGVAHGFPKPSRPWGSQICGAAFEGNGFVDRGSNSVLPGTQRLGALSTPKWVAVV